MGSESGGVPGRRGRGGCGADGEPDAGRGGDHVAGRRGGGHDDRPVPGAGRARLPRPAADGGPGRRAGRDALDGRADVRQAGAQGADPPAPGPGGPPGRAGLHHRRRPAGRQPGDRAPPGADRRYPGQAPAPAAARGGQCPAGIRPGRRGDPRQPVARTIPPGRSRRPGPDPGQRGPPPRRDDHDRQPPGGYAAAGPPAGRAGRRLAARLAGRAAGHRPGRGCRVRAGRGGVPVPDLLLHLAGHRACPVRPAGPRPQHSPAVAGAGLLRGDPGDRRADLRAADLQRCARRPAATACPR